MDLLKNLLEALSTEEEKEFDLSINNEEGFAIDSINQANYYTKRYKDNFSKVEEIEKIAQQQIDAYIEKVNSWKESVSKSHTADMEYCSSLLEEWAKSNLSGKKSIKLIDGTLGFRAQQDLIEFEKDEQEIIKQLEEIKLGEAVKIKKTISKTELKNLAEIVDEQVYYNDILIDGITVTKREDKFSIK